MFRKGMIVAALASFLAIPSLAKAVENPYEITLGGGGSNSADVNGFTANVNGSFGYYFTDTLEVAIRQSLQYTDIGGAAGDGSAWNASTRIALDMHFPIPAADGGPARFVPYVGANIGYVYGETVNDTFEAAPEAGVKIYLDSRTFIFAQAEYQFFFDKASDADSNFGDGAFVYTIGLGFRF